MFKIATWNVNSLRVRLPHVLDFLLKHQPDILAIQEIKTTNDNFPQLEIEAVGYQVIYSGQKAYNGVAILSKKLAKDIVVDLPNFQDDQRRVIGATFGDLRLINLYVPNGESVSSAKYEYKLKWLESLHAFLKAELKTHSHLVVLGDFNIAPTDLDVYDPKGWEGSVLVSEKERAALQKILALGFLDSYRLFDEKTGGYSFWDYRAASFVRDQGLRLDLILVSSVLQKKCQRCYVDKMPRGLDRPSDHAPVILEMA